VACSCCHGNESSGCIKCWAFFEWLSNCRLSRNARLHGIRVMEISRKYEERECTKRVEENREVIEQKIKRNI
jgi:hypothetical protein